MTRFLITGGGTAGHVLPGIAIADELASRGFAADDMHFVGSARGVETRLVPEAGYPLTVLPGRGIARKLTKATIKANAGAVAGLIRAVGTAFGLVRSERPEVVVSLGGYASVPCALWAAIFRVPIVVAEQNAVPGLANKLIGKFAKVCGVSFDGTDLPNPVWTGNPVREEILAVDRAAGRDAARQRLGLPLDRVVLAVFGGSLGALRINNAVLEAVEAWSDRTDLAIRHVIGARDFAELSARNPLDGDSLGSGAGVVYQQIEYENDMPSLYAAADVLLCRSGATSVAEIAAVGIPAVLVPLPGAPGDHQTANAMALVNAGAAVRVVDHELDGARLVAEVEALVAASEQRSAMALAGRSVARPDAASRLADLVLDAASTSGPAAPTSP